MRTRALSVALCALTAILIAGHAVAADDAVRRDLFAVITLQGLPCGEVVEVATKGENDHIASCKDGNRYHVFLNGQGRVVVERQ
ncbi:MAG: hypothetical protein ABI981_14720 [Betaproteobacteria bacterium]